MGKLTAQQQLAVLIAIKSGVQEKKLLNAVLDTLKDENVAGAANVWQGAIDNCRKGMSYGKILRETGVFFHEVETIVMVHDFSEHWDKGLDAGIDYLTRRFFMAPALSEC